MDFFLPRKNDSHFLYVNTPKIHREKFTQILITEKKFIVIFQEESQRETLPIIFTEKVIGIFTEKNKIALPN